jgi:hypothetical protein
VSEVVRYLGYLLTVTHPTVTSSTQSLCEIKGGVQALLFGSEALGKHERREVTVYAQTCALFPASHTYDPHQRQLGKFGRGLRCHCVRPFACHGDR